MNFAGALRVGCAGWTIPAKFKTQFGEGESHLARYATRFSAVEINSSFHRPHRPATYVRWADSTPIDFRFSVKVPKQITHERRLRSVDEEVRSFLVGPRALGAKLGVLLVQLPPSLAFESDVAERFFANLRKETSVAIALEPRHPSWFGPAAEELLLHYAIARVAADPACVSAAAKPGGDRLWGYYRLHGSPRIYYSNYDEAYLQALARDLKTCIAAGCECWCIFDNTADGAAPANGLRLRDLIGSI